MRGAFVALASLFLIAAGPHHHEAPARYTRSVVSYTPPDVTLVSLDGDRVPLSRALGHEGPLILQFIFTTCPTVCPALSTALSAAQKELGTDLGSVRMVSISIDPEHDTPARLRDYAKRYRAGRQWWFLTGSLEDVVAVQKAFDAYRGNKMRHQPVTFLRRAPGEPWLRLDGLLSGAELAAEYRRLIGR
ncbi:MAG TPA: SCO family protein [Thermoanaerobaculia bacterium]|nr:SCO family protein [Thermoanaerobaculia bacterium]